MSLRTAIQEAEDRLAARERSRFTEEEKRDKELKFQEAKLSEMLKHMMPATPKDYLAWLHGWVDRGGFIGDVQNRAMQDDKAYYFNGWNQSWFIAKEDFVLVPRHGSQLLHIIVSADVRVIDGTAGHSKVFYMANFTTNDPDHVVVYSDTR